MSLDEPKERPKEKLGSLVPGQSGVVLTSAMVSTMASRSSMECFISVSARFIINWLNSSHCWREEVLWAEETMISGLANEYHTGREAD